MNLEINKAILRVWKQSYANSKYMNEDSPYSFDDEFLFFQKSYLVWNRWDQVNIMLRI